MPFPGQFIYIIQQTRSCLHLASIAWLIWWSNARKTWKAFGFFEEATIARSLEAMRKIVKKRIWGPHELPDDTEGIQKFTRRVWLNRFEGKSFLHPITTVDETGICYEGIKKNNSHEDPIESQEWRQGQIALEKMAMLYAVRIIVVLSLFSFWTPMNLLMAHDIINLWPIRTVQ